MSTDSESLIDWYWNHGRLRTGAYELSRGGWLDQLYAAQRVEAAIAFSQQYPKSSLAVWGPSQTGKSSLLEGYLDRDDDPSGALSALSWPGGESARFRKRQDTPADSVGFNPYNNGLDGSGCVSRFQLATDVSDPRHPIEIRLVEPVQLMHAFAMGYLSECRTTRENGVKLKLDSQQFRALLDKHEQAISSAGLPDRQAFQQLHQIADVLDLLILSGQDRYENLKPDQRSLRERLLSSSLVASIRAVEQFAAELFWDGRTKLTELFSRLRGKRQDLTNAFGSRRIFCSLRAAALFLDIAAYEKLVTPQAAARVSSEVERLMMQISADRVNIGASGTDRLVRAPDDFGFFQGLVLELIIPVRRAALVGQINQFRDFLEVADLVDFPGVAVEERQSEHSELDLEKLPLDKSHLLLTQVLKRGKTASIVAGYAKDLTVHGFSLLNRIGRFVSKSNQLLTGIYTWWKCYFPDYSPDGQLQSPLPLNLVLTFSATLLNDVSLNGIPDSLEHYFRKFGQLGPLADPNVISHTLATNYPQLPDGHLNSTVENLKKTLDLIAADPAFARQFRTERSKNSLREAAYNGGTDNLFSLLREQAANVPREQLRENRKRMLDDTLRGLLAEALPRGANAGEQRKLFFRSWGPRLRRALAEAARDFDPSTQVDPSARVSKLLRTLLDVNFEELDPLPRNAGAPQNRRVVLDYIDRQMVKWVNSRKSQPLLTDGLTALGLTNSAELVRLLGYLSDGVTKQSVATWLIANFSRVPPGEPARHARRYLAVKIAEALRPTSDRRREYPGTSMIEATLALHNGDDESMPEYEHSYHYQYVIHPWLDEIDTLADQPVTGERPKQPGDDELVALVRDNSQLRTLTEVPDAR